MRPGQLGEYRVPSDAYLHPDGERVVFVVTQMDIEADEYVRQLWFWDGQGARRLTSGRMDHSPRWSRDGTMLAFLRKGPEDDDKPQIALMPVDGGEAEVVTDFELGVSEIAWSPDGTTIAAVVPEYVDDIDDEDERKRLPRRIEHPSFRFDNLGWTYDRRSHIWLIDASTHGTTQLISGDCSETGVLWNPDGTSITYTSATDEDRWTNPLNHVFTVAVSGGEPHIVTARGAWMWSGFDRDGTLFVLGRETDRITLLPPQLHRVEPDGGLSRLTDLDRNLMPQQPPSALCAPRFVDGGRLTCVLEDRGAHRVVIIDSDGSVSDIARGARVITGWDPNDDGSAGVFTASSPTQPGEVYRWDGSSEKALTSLNEEFIESVDLVAPEEFTFESDGAEVHGWVYLPHGEGTVALLFNIHGGPATQYGWGFFDEFQVYVGAGYGVVAINPRGSSGYGYDHVSVPCGRWSEEVPPDMQDLKAAPYAAAERFGRLDTSRMGIMGGSYGGLSTAMVTSMDQSYRSAVAERGVYNWVSMAGTTDIPFFLSLYLGTDMPHGADELWRASALARAHKITTPTLVIHSETDFRCPIEQGQQLFGALYRGGTDTELLLFPSGESHELSRSGTPKHRVERFEAILEWHARYLR
ncbi:MAG: S9 family peptidase [Acidimicrobiia bacterium]|nr:MAG: S9 family peptidase [Acidimicrobiia bacterium]